MTNLVKFLTIIACLHAPATFCVEKFPLYTLAIDEPQVMSTKMLQIMQNIEKKCQIPDEKLMLSAEGIQDRANIKNFFRTYISSRWAEITDLESHLINVFNTKEHTSYACHSSTPLEKLRAYIVFDEVEPDQFKIAAFAWIKIRDAQMMRIELFMGYGYESATCYAECAEILRIELSNKREKTYIRPYGKENVTALIQRGWQVKMTELWSSLLRNDLVDLGYLHTMPKEVFADTTHTYMFYENTTKNMIEPFEEPTESDHAAPPPLREAW